MILITQFEFENIGDITHIDIECISILYGIHQFKGINDL
jgi:hypothetical protein